MKPASLPKNPSFSSGPCAKRPGWTLDVLKDAAVGRSHRAKIAKTKLVEVIERSKKVLGIPADYVLGIVPASDTGAIEMALWSLLGERGVDVLAWESFGSSWASDCKSQLKLSDLRVVKAGILGLRNAAVLGGQGRAQRSWLEFRDFRGLHCQASVRLGRQRRVFVVVRQNQ